MGADSFSVGYSTTKAQTLLHAPFNSAVKVISKNERGRSNFNKKIRAAAVIYTKISARALMYTYLSKLKPAQGAKLSAKFSAQRMLL